ncbi:MAG: ISAzo13 family transposase [Acidimicrobiales bacterium]
MEHDTAGDPMTGIKWTRRTTEKIAEELRLVGIVVCANTVAKLLKGLEYRLRVNHKKLSRHSPPDRDAQFAYIAARREDFARAGLPVVSIDSKKRELVGNFKNSGATWGKEPTLVNDHDFRSDAKGIALPHGIYDLAANHGYLSIGTTHDTPAFAVDNLVRWWVEHGRQRYSQASGLLVLADGGGSNGARTRAWKHCLQERLCDRHGLTVTVCHYPAGASKWNPVEHRMFSEISKNWAGRPLDSYETILNYARTTRTSTGLQVSACLVERDYPTGVKISDEVMRQLRLRPHETQPTRNYTLSPR